MDRRSFLVSGAAGGLGAVGATGLALPALAQPAPTILWRCVSAFPQAAETVFSGAMTLARAVREATDGAFEIEVVPAEPSARGSAAVDAVRAGQADLCHASGHDSAIAKPSYAFAAGIPFGLNTRGMQAWLRQGEGAGLLDAYFAKEGLFHLPGGATGTPMGGWFKRDIKRVEDLAGLRMRIAGLGGRVLSKLGVVPVEGEGDLLEALTRGTLDAAEWIGPEEDERLGLVKAAPYYAYPGWWDGGSSLSFFIARDRYDALSPSHRSLLATAASAVTIDMLSLSDSRNPAALKRLVAAGAQLRPTPQAVLDACFRASGEVLSEIAATDADFATLLRSMTTFRNEAFLQQQVAEHTFDTFMMIQQREGALSPTAG